MKRWWIVVLLLLSVGLNLGLLAQRARAEKEAKAAAQAAAQAELAADPDPQDRHPRRDKPPFLVKLIDRMASDIGVSGEQRQKFVAIQESFFERTFGTRENLRRRQHALRENLLSPTPDRELAERQVTELGEAQKELEQAFLDNYFQSTAILDKDQQRRYRRLILELRRMRWERGGRQEEGGPRQQRRRELREAWDGEARDG